MIDLKDFIIKEVPRKTPRFKGEIARRKYYATYCDKCNKLRGYLSKSAKETECRSCSQSVKDNLAKNHWTKLGLQHPLKGSTSPEQKVTNRIRNNLRSRFYRAIRDGYKNGSAISDLGCTVEEFRVHIESLWKPSMSWNNWSKTGWHMDHIRPLDSFNLNDREEVKKACHYTNIQPMWAKENLSKGNRLIADIIIEIIQ